MRRKLFIFALAAICLVFVSGIGVGVVGRRAFQPVIFHSVLVEELDLTPDQRHKIQEIWSNVAESHSPPPMAELERADAERWQAIDQLLTPQQRTQYARIQQRFEARMQELDQGNRERMARAEEQTKQLLTPAQREKYERLLARPTHHFLYLRTTTQP
ncbi:MAG TPA: Spy/CpxP family protein refolding chaperone [Tepidisphaeraceae bacterium]|jgi:Spy/CpxP family protein refolding chaperone